MALTPVILTTALVVILSPSLAGQSFQVIPPTTTATVGDTITIGFRVRLHERDLLLDTVPRPLEALPPGVRVFSVDKLTRAPDRVFQGQARLAIYRTGTRPIPIFGLPFMRIVEGIPRATLSSDSAFVEITPVLPAGNPGLKDIKEPEQVPATPLLPLLLLLILGAAGLLYRGLIRRRRPPSVALAAEVPAPPVARDAYDFAVERLDRLERERWPARGDVARHYEAVADVLRDYLEEAEGVGARERTTSELVWALPPHLSGGGLRSRCYEILGDADLVKFAEARPSEPGATDFLARARWLLEAWHEARPEQESVSALR